MQYFCKPYIYEKIYEIFQGVILKAFSQKTFYTKLNVIEENVCVFLCVILIMGMLKKINCMQHIRSLLLLTIYPFLIWKKRNIIWILFYIKTQQWLNICRMWVSEQMYLHSIFAHRFIKLLTYCYNFLVLLLLCPFISLLV